MSSKSTNYLMQNKVFSWIALGTAGLLLIPLFGGWPWTISDFVIMGILIFGSATLFILLARRFQKQRIIIGIALALAFLWLWAELAVGLFTNWGS